MRDFAVVDKTPYAMDLAWTNADGAPETAQVFKNNGTSHLTKILSFFRSEDFSLACNYSTPADVPGQIKEIGTYNLGGVAPGIDGKSQKIKVKVKLDEHGCFKVDEAHMVEKLPPPAEDVSFAARFSSMRCPPTPPQPICRLLVVVPCLGWLLRFGVMM